MPIVYTRGYWRSYFGRDYAYRALLSSAGIDTRYESLLTFDFSSFPSAVLLAVIQKLVRAERDGKGELGRAYSDGLLDGILMSLGRKEA